LLGPSVCICVAGPTSGWIVRPGFHETEHWMTTAISAGLANMPSDGTPER
jgi:hypothetical protein